MTTTRTTRSRRARDSLSREIIVSAAEAVVNRDGLDRMTFQSIGQELDAHPTSVYRHFRDKDELMLSLIDTLRARSYTGALHETDDWVADLRTQAHLIHDHYLRYPQFALQMALRRPTDIASVEFTLRALRRGGYDAPTAGLHLRAIGQLVRAAASIQAAMDAAPEDEHDADELAWEATARRADDEDHPNVRWIGADLPGIRDPRGWELALDLLLESIERRAPGGH